MYTAHMHPHRLATPVDVSSEQPVLVPWRTSVLRVLGGKLLQSLSLLTTITKILLCVYCTIYQHIFCEVLPFGLHSFTSRFLQDRGVPFFPVKTSLRRVSAFDSSFVT